MPRRKGGLYLPLDVNFWDDPRIVRAGEKAAVLYLAMCLAAKRLGADALTGQQVERLSVPGWQKRLATLLNVGLVKQDGDTYRPVEIRHRPGRRYIARSIRLAVLDRDRVCQHCGGNDRLELDHVVPYSHGGPDTIENLRLLCKPCNIRRGAPADGT